MQVRSTARPITVARRPVVTAPAVVRAAVQPAAQPIASRGSAIKVKTDAGFGSDMLQHCIFALTNLGQIVSLGGLGGLIKALPKGALGIVNVGYGAFNLVRDVLGLKKATNTKKSDDYTRIAGGAAIVTGGVAILAGALVGPWLPLVGAGVAAAGYLARAVGIWNDETRW